MSRFIDQFVYLLFDVCGTLVYGYDRYGPGVDYYPAYTKLAGKALPPERLQALVDELFVTIRDAEHGGLPLDPFPSLHEFALQMDHAADLPPDELERVEAVFAEHECGKIPPHIADAVRQLGATHRLGLISTLWGRPDPFIAELQRHGLLDLFHPRIWSPEVGCVKPAARIFARALEQIDAPPSRVLYTGDTFFRDVYGPKQAGMAAAWVNPNGLHVPEEYGVQPDRILRDIRDLLEIE